VIIYAVFKLVSFFWGQSVSRDHRKKLLMGLTFFFEALSAFNAL